VLVRHFEDLQGDAVPDLIQRDVAKLLAVPPLVTGHTHTAQQAVPPSLIQRIANYDEVVAALRDTAYEDFISRRWRLANELRLSSLRFYSGTAIVTAGLNLGSVALGL
jgi:ClpP class serine protease